MTRLAKSTEAAMPQIHQQKGKVVEHVDGRDRIVEFDAVEQRGSPSRRQMLRRCRSPWQRRIFPSRLAPVENICMAVDGLGERPVKAFGFFGGEDMACPETRLVDVESTAAMFAAPPPE